MDAILRTQSDTCQFTMSEVVLYPNDSGGVCTLMIVSRPFSATTQFYFDKPPLRQFAEQLSAIYESLNGEAKRGHVTVTGLLTQFNQQMQQLRFSFTTDQTALQPFISALLEIANDERSDG